MDEDDYHFEEDDAEPTKNKKTRKTYAGANKDPQIIRRWERINEEVSIKELIADLYDGESRDLFNCPFHGRDSRPSFKVYPEKNNAWCFGCPDNTGFYDCVRFAAAIWECSHLKAIALIEKQYNLPPLGPDPDDYDEDDEDDYDVDRDGNRLVRLTIPDLLEPFIKHSAYEILQNPVPHVAREYIRIFFDSIPEDDQSREDADNQLLCVARILGREAINRIMCNKWPNGLPARRRARERKGEEFEDGS